MSRSPKKARPAPEALAPVPDTIVNQFAPEGMLTAAEVEAATRRFKKALLERVLGAELGHHLTQEADATPAEAPANPRNGSSAKTVLTDDKILALYARGLTVRDIQAFLHKMYAVEVSPDLISTVTDAVQHEVRAWQARPLEPMYPVVFFDALRVTMRDEAVVQNKAVYLALAILPDGSRDILGIWIEQTEGAKFWMKVFADLQTRGCRDILIAVTDGLKGIPEALEAALAAAEAGPWGRRFPTVFAAWRRAWVHVIPFFAFPPDIRRTLYTTNALENVNRHIRKVTKTRGQFPNDDAALTLIWLAVRNLTARWKRGARHWKLAMNQFAIL